MNQIPIPAELLSKLIQFDTTNPPGNERACIEFLRTVLSDAGIESQLFAKTPERPNLIARLRGCGDRAPLLLHGHVDVVSTENQPWSRAPFGGEVVDGYVWGRGALDMKGGIAMLVTAFLRSARSEVGLPGDVVLAIVSDEEAGGDFGARFLVEEHPEQFHGIQFALGEFGGFSLPIGGKRFYPIMVAEKRMCWMRATFRAQGGHGSMPVRDGAMGKLGKFLTNLNRQRLPVHITPVARDMISSIANHLGGVNGLVFRQLANPSMTNRVLDMLGKRGAAFDPLLHHTVSPTILHGSSKLNVIPSEVSVELDGRLLPGFQPADLITEVRQLSGDDMEIDLLRHDPAPDRIDMGLFGKLSEILRELDPSGIPVPLLLSGVTDGRYFARLGIQPYGFLPMNLPADFNFINTIHAADERIPVDALDFGVESIFRVLQNQ